MDPAIAVPQGRAAPAFGGRGELNVGFRGDFGGGGQLNVDGRSGPRRHRRGIHRRRAEPLQRQRRRGHGGGEALDDQAAQILADPGIAAEQVGLGGEDQRDEVLGEEVGEGRALSGVGHDRNKNIK